MKLNFTFFAFLLCILMYFVGDAASQNQRANCIQNVVRSDAFRLFQPVRDDVIDNRLLVVNTLIEKTNATVITLREVNKCYSNEISTQSDLRDCIKTVIKYIPAQRYGLFDQLYTDSTLENREVMTGELLKRGASAKTIEQIDECYDGNLMLILGIVFGVIILLLLILGAIGCYIKRRNH